MHSMVISVESMSIATTRTAPRTRSARNERVVAARPGAGLGHAVRRADVDEAPGALPAAVEHVQRCGAALPGDRLGRARVERGRLEDQVHAERRAEARRPRSRITRAALRYRPHARGLTRPAQSLARARAVVDVRPGGERDAHPALPVRLRLAEQPQVGLGHRQRVVDAVEADAARLDRRRRSRPTRRASRRRESTGSPRIARAWRSNSFCACVHIVTMPGVVRPRAHLGEPDLVALDEELDAEDAAAAEAGGDLARDVARLLQRALADIGCGCHDST